MRLLQIVIFILCLSACATQNNGASDTSEVDTLQAARTRVSLGLTYLKNGNYVQAKTNLDKALEYAPELGDVHFALAYYYQQVSEQGLAKEYYQRALDLDEDNPDLINSYGAFLCEVGDYKAADAYLMKAVKTRSYSRSAETYENLAICSHSQGKLKESQQYLRTALKHQPGRGKSWYMLIELLLSQQLWQEASQAYRKYEKVVPVNSDTLKLAIEIENGLGKHKVAKGYIDMLGSLYPDDAETPRRVVLTTSNTLPASDSNTEDTVVLADTPKVEETASDLSQSAVTFHILQKGETLYQISRRYDVRVQSLIDWNNISDVSSLAIGQKILVSEPN